MSAFSSLVEIFRPRFSIAKYALGKYIIGAASLLHLGWAVLLCVDERAANATPLSILAVTCNHSIGEMVSVLLLVSFMGIAFLNYRLRRAITKAELVLLLIPQQVVLLSSAGAGVYAASRQHYADGTPMSWVHILADQLPNVIMALLYSLAVIESMQPPKIYHNGRNTV
jgi:hypothetical protein